MRCAADQDRSQIGRRAKREDQDRAGDKAGHGERQDNGEEDPRHTRAEETGGIDLVGRYRLQARHEDEHSERDVLIRQHGDQRREGAQPLQRSGHQVQAMTGSAG